MKFLAIKLLSIVLSIISIIGNALVCHIIVRVKSMKTSMNYIILNLAILDAITGYLAIFYTISNDDEGELGILSLEQVHNRSSVAVEVLCKIEYSFWLGSNVSPFLFTGMAYERYKAIVHPLSRIHGISTKKCVWLLCFSWIIGVGMTTFDMLTVAYDYKKSMCIYVSYSWCNWNAYRITLLVTNFFIPSVLISILYLRIIIALRSQDQVLQTQGEAQRARARRQKRVIIVVIIATITFVLCMSIPQGLYLLDLVFKNLFTQTRLFHDIYVALVAFNSAFNPIIYFIFIKPFRDGFKTAFKRKQNDVITN